MTVSVSDNLLHFMISYVILIIACTLVARFYVWPAIKDRAPKAALTPLLLYATLRVNGLMFIMPGLASADLPRGFAVPTAYGDLTATILALLAVWSLRSGNALAIPLVWLFNVEGSLDLVYANIATFREHMDPATIGVGYYLAAINVPIMLVVHTMIFIYLLRPHD